MKMIEKLNKRTKKTVVRHLEKLVAKYGLDETRCVVNHYFAKVRAKANLESDVAEKEQELAKMKNKLEY